MRLFGLICHQSSKTKTTEFHRLTKQLIYFNSLDINARATAEEYIRRTPKQIDTEYRRKFETEFGWTHIA